MKVPILLPNIFNYPFTYQSDLNLKVGEYVIVPFGKTKMVGVVWNHFEKKTIKPIIYKKLPIREADQAHKIMENNNNIGKIILEVF